MEGSSAYVYSDYAIASQAKQTKAILTYKLNEIYLKCH